MVNTHTTLPTPTLNLSTLELSKALEAKDNTFQFYYFNVHTHGATGRALLAYADAKWSNIYPAVSPLFVFIFFLPRPASLTTRTTFSYLTMFGFSPIELVQAREGPDQVWFPSLGVRDNR